MERQFARGGKVAYLMWALAMCGYIFAATCRSSFSAIGIEAAEHFGTTSTGLSSFVYLQLFVYALMQIPAGVMLDAFGPKRLIAAGCLLMSVGQGMLAMSTAIGGAVAGRAVVGMGDALIFISVIRLLAAWFPMQRLPLMNQLTGQIGNCGQIISVYPFAWMMALAGWQKAFLTLSATGVTIAACVALLLRDTPQKAQRARLDAARLASVAAGMREALHNPGTYCGFWVHSMTWVSANTMNQLWGFPFLLTVERFSNAQASSYLAIGMVLCVAWSLFFGRVASNHPFHGRAAIVYGTVCSQMLLWAIVLITPGPHPIWLLVALLLAISSGTPAASIAFDYVRDSNHASNLGSATGLANIGGFVSAGCVLLGVGLLLDVQGASEPDLYTDAAMRVAMSFQYLVWIIGLAGFTIMLPHTINVIRARYAAIGADLQRRQSERKEQS